MKTDRVTDFQENFLELFNDIKRRHWENEQKMKKNLAEMKSEYDQELKTVYDKNLRLQRQLNDGLMRGTCLLGTIIYFTDFFL